MAAHPHYQRNIGATGRKQKEFRRDMTQIRASTRTARKTVMSALAALEKASLSVLTDPRLFREYAYVDGSWVAAEDGAFVDVTDPATGARIGCVPALSAAETAAAIDAAHAAFASWSAAVTGSLTPFQATSTPFS